MLALLALIPVQEAPPASPSPAQLEEVEVVGRRGAARVAPEQELGPEEIDNLGAYDIGEVIARLSERLGFQQPPVVIVNGRPVVDARNFTGFPPDALVRVEALPPQAGALYGGDPGRRVVNIVLEPEFRSRDALAKASRPTAGGTTTLSLDARQSEIQGSSTFQMGLQGARTTPLWADERPGYGRDHPGGGGNTLRPQAQTGSVNLSATGTLSDWSTSFSASLQTRQDRFVSSSVAAADRAETRQETDALTMAGGLAGRALGWSVRWGLDGLVSEGRQRGATDVTARTVSAVAKLSADRTLIDLPAGPAQMTVDTQYLRSRSDIRAAGVTATPSSRALELRSGLTLPVTSSQSDRGGPRRLLGDLALNLGGRLRLLDEADAQGTGLNAGVAWSPSGRVRLGAQFAQATDAPTREQRFDPIRYGPPRTFYDFRRGEAVEIQPILGGAPDLQAQETQTLSLSGSTGPFGAWGLQASVDLQNTRATNAIGALPALTPATETAFPDRILRDASGRLTGIDQRPINLKAISSQTLSSGLTANIPLGSGAPEASRRGSVQVAFNHTWRLEDRITINEALPRLDQLAGDGGGLSRHQLALRLDGRYARWGLNLAATWRSGARLRRDLGQDGPDDLLLSPLTLIGFTLSTVLSSPRSEASDTGPRRRTQGLRLELGVENLFDARPTATLGDGRPAPAYGRDDQDPLGRVIRLSLSRRF